MIAFPHGGGLAYNGFAEVTGVDCVGLDSTAPVEWAAWGCLFGVGGPVGVGAGFDDGAVEGQPVDVRRRHRTWNR